MDRDRIVIAEILRPRGNRGELLAQCQSDIPGRLEHLKQAQARLTGGSDVAIEISEAWAHGADWVLKFEGVDSIDAAERFRGAEVWVQLQDRASLPDGEFFQSDLVGCNVIDSMTGKSLGVVEGWHEFGGRPLMAVSVNGREVLIPFVSAICPEVDLDRRTIRVELPEGLLEL